ncbi:MAG: FitA-like ribbon-helix-helix domain-containing protein [Solirubrobacteraceae bacterium]
MTKMIQVRDVPEGVHRVLKARASAAGLSLSDYIKQDLEAAAAQPSIQELDARIAARGRSGLPSEFILESLRSIREG